MLVYNLFVNTFFTKPKPVPAAFSIEKHFRGKVVPTTYKNLLNENLFERATEPKQ